MMSHFPIPQLRTFPTTQPMTTPVDKQPHRHSLDAPALTTLMLEPVAARPAAGALVIDTAAPRALGAQQRQHLTHWLRQQPVPVIGYGQADTETSQLFDAVAVRESELELILRTIAQCPQAASLLVQTLRVVENLPAAQALVVESLAYATLQSGAEFQRWLAAHPPGPSDRSQPLSDPPVLIERAGNALHIALNRPHNENALSVEMRDALTEVFTMVAIDNDIDAVHVSARGPIFSSGGDLKEFGHVSDPVTGHQIRSAILPAKLLLERAAIYHFHVHRACIGAGIELPAFAGYVSADPKTFFWLPELGMGLIPGAGGCVSITRRIGRQRTAWLALTGKKINAQRALDWGLIDAITSRPASGASDDGNAT